MLEFSDSTISLVNMWSSDAYYYDPQEFDDDVPESSEVELPAEYNPVWLMPDPWFTSSQCEGDFILVAEFSELEGPKPLITIPKDIPGNFDLNEFSVRIMTVDCHSHPSEGFRIHEDRSIVISEVKYGIHAYVHHFTLYDSKARGFVRPFCMAYVTADNSKLEKFYDDIQKEFDSICWKMRQGNFMVFVKDMTYHLTDLQYTKEKFLERQYLQDNSEKCNTRDPPTSFIEVLKAEDEILLQSLTLDSLIHAIKEVKYILQTVNTLIASLDLTAEESEELGVLISSNSVVEMRSGSAGGCPIPTPRFSLSHSVQYSSSLDQPVSPSEAKATLRRSGSYTHVSSQCDVSGDDVCAYEPKLVRTTNKRRYDKTLRTLHELCSKSARLGLNKLRYVQKYFAKDLATLILEKREGEVLEPNQGLLTVGKCVHMNFLPSQLPGRVVRKSQSATFSDSDDTTSFESAESFLTCEDVSPTRPCRVVLSSSLDDLDLTGHNPQDDTLLNTSLTASTETSLSLHSLDSAIVHEYDSMTQSSTNSGSLSDVDTSSVRLSDMADVTTDLASDSVLNKSFRVFSLPDHLYHLDKGSSGYGLLQVVNRYSFSPHLMFSLLCGRPVVVMGTKKKESDITSLLTALSFLVPGFHRDNCKTTIRSKALTLQDFEDKLIGLVSVTNTTRGTLIPKHLENRCTVLDIDQKLLWAPCYQGGVLSEIYIKRKCHTCDSTYLLYIYSMLQEVLMKAYVFYHTFIVNVSSKLPVMYTDPAEAKIAFEKAEQHFLSNMKMSLHDCEIVKCVASLLQSQIDSLHNDTIQVLSDVAEKDIKLKNILCQTFKLKGSKTK